MYQLIQNSTSVRHIPSGTVFPMPAVESFGFEYQAWLDAGNVPEPAPVSPPLTQRELDELRYKKRADVKDQLIAWMAADNMSRVRAGAWTVSDLTGLINDPAVADALSYMHSLSYEIVASKLQQATHPLLTTAIKASWAAKLAEHFYLEP